MAPSWKVRAKNLASSLVTTTVVEGGLEPTMTLRLPAAWRKVPCALLRATIISASCIASPHAAAPAATGVDPTDMNAKLLQLPQQGNDALRAQFEQEIDKGA